MSTPAFKFEKRAVPRTPFERTGVADVVNRRVNGEGHGLPVLTVNVGEGGAMITLDGEVNTGDLLRIDFKSPPGEEPVTIAARVMWIRKNGLRLLGNFTAGVAFQPADQAGVARLVELVRKVQGGPR